MYCRPDLTAADHRPLEQLENSGRWPQAGIAAEDRRRALRDALAVAAATSVAAAVSVIGLWIAAAATVRADYRQYLTTMAIAAAQQVDAGLHQSLTDPDQLNGAEYLRAVEPLRRMRSALPDVRYIYTMVPDADQVRFVLDAALPGDNDTDGVEDQAGLLELYEDEDPFLVATLRTGQPTATPEPLTDKWGTFMTGWAPLLDEQGVQYGVLGIDVDAGIYLARLQRARTWAMVGLIPALLLVGSLGIGFYHIRLRGLTAHRDAEQAFRILSTEQQRLSNVVEGTSVGTWESRVDPAGRSGDRITVDARWAAMLGFRESELDPMEPGRFIAMFVHPDDQAATLAAIDAALADPGRLFEVDARMRHARGHWVWTDVRGRVIERDAQGQPLLMVGTQMDVTARKTAELALVESEANFRSLFELSPVGICLCELATGRFLQVNDSLVRSTGYTRDELLQLRHWDITPERWHQVERDRLGELQNFSRPGIYEKEYQRKDGTCYPVQVSGTRMKDATGRDVIWAIVEDISTRKEMESQLADAARRDRLTGLANRTQFIERLQQAVERVRDGSQERFAVLFLDFDRFKLVNDAMGHEAGDGLLREIAARLRETLTADATTPDPEGRLVARFGGDEFLVLLNDLPDDQAAEREADDLVASLARTYSVNGRDVYSTASIGIVTSSQCVESAEAVIRNADVAMYEAKRSGRACAVMFDDAMRARLTRYVTVDSNLRRALGTDELSLVYQPIIELDSNTATSVEALSRWLCPQLGQVSPSEFIPVAEESGLIASLGQWVLREACQTLARWRQLDPERAPQTICVNISRAELALGDRLLARVQDALDGAGLPPECLRLEVTERDVMRDPTSTLRLMHALRALGVHLAMDDFGTGTSSLGCLRDFPFDVVKIDRSFISDVTGNPDVLAMIHAAISLVENLGKTSVAEGVETSQQVAILQSLGCHYAQGYYFSRPLTAAQMLEFMSRPEPARPA